LSSSFVLSQISPQYSQSPSSSCREGQPAGVGAISSSVRLNVRAYEKLEKTASKGIS
jgi:hypothetical protein